MTNTSADRSRQRAARARLAAVGLVALLASCSITEPGRGGDAGELARNRQKWASAGLHDYEFDYQLSCFCAPETTEPVHVMVRGDQLASVSRNRDGLPALRQYGMWPTVPALFDDVQRLIDQKSDRLEVTYDPTYGYPRSIVVDVYLQAADDESSQTASNLRPLH